LWYYSRIHTIFVKDYYTATKTCRERRQPAHVRTLLAPAATDITRQSEQTQPEAYVGHHERNLNRIKSSKITLAAGCVRIYPSQEWQTKLPTRKARNGNEETASTTKRHHNQLDYLSIYPTPHAPLSSSTPKSQESLHTVKGMRKVGQPTPDKNPLPR